MASRSEEVLHTLREFYGRDPLGRGGYRDDPYGLEQPVDIDNNEVRKIRLTIREAMEALKDLDAAVAYLAKVGTTGSFDDASSDIKTYHHKVLDNVSVLYNYFSDMGIDVEKEV